MALPCTVLPCTEASDVPGLYRGLQLATPSHRRELQTQVSTSAGLLSAVANTAVDRIVLAPGNYYLSAELSITRSLILEAAVAGSVVLDAQANSSSPRRVLNINLGSLGVVQVIGLNITGGNSGDADGGGVFVLGGKVTLSSCTISGNTAYGGYRMHGGGGVAVTGGTVAISSCTISGNTAGSVFGGTGYGGGVYIVSSTVTITSSSIYGNTAYFVRALVQNFPSPPC